MRTPCMSVPDCMCCGGGDSEAARTSEPASVSTTREMHAQRERGAARDARRQSHYWLRGGSYLQREHVLLGAAAGLAAPPGPHGCCRCVGYEHGLVIWFDCCHAEHDLLCRCGRGHHARVRGCVAGLLLERINGGSLRTGRWRQSHLAVALLDRRWRDVAGCTAAHLFGCRYTKGSAFKRPRRGRVAVTRKEES